MTNIRKATTEDIKLIKELAWIAFPATYKDILTKEQIDYMMNWMYSPENLHKQMTEEGHIYYLAYVDNKAAGYVSIQKEKICFTCRKYMFCRNSRRNISGNNCSVRQRKL